MLIFLFLANTFCMKQKRKKFFKALLCVVCGIMIGGVNGFFGGGGGMVCVPFLLMLGLENKKAHATAILTMLPISIASALVYYSHGFVNLWFVLFVGIGTVVGAVLGAMLLKKIPNKTLLYVFPIIMIAAGIKMIL